METVTDVQKLTQFADELGWANEVIFQKDGLVDCTTERRTGFFLKGDANNMFLGETYLEARCALAEYTLEARDQDQPDMQVHLDEHSAELWDALQKILQVRSDLNHLSPDELQTAIMREALDLYWEQTTEWLEDVEEFFKDPKNAAKWKAHRQAGIN